MTAPNMTAITASLEWSLQNCSINHHQRHQSSGVLGGGRERRSSSDEADSSEEMRSHHSLQNPEASLVLNSNTSLPYYWEQCLDLKTAEVYFINWRSGMRAKEDPRLSQDYINEEYYSEDDSSYDSEESSSESSPPTTRKHCRVEKEGHVLVVGGCKSCLMYFMVPKLVYDCPKCNGQLLHFDRSENGCQ